MAKAKQITHDEEIKINPKSKNTTYELEGDNITLSFTGEFKDDTGKEIYDYKNIYHNFATKNNNDLIITTLFTKSNGATKKVITTIKNYFADDTKNYKAKYKSFALDASKPYWINSGYPITPVTTEGTRGLYGSFADANYFILGSKGNDQPVILTNVYTNFVYDPKGNDSYISRHVNNRDTVVDLAGNDSYRIDTDNGSLASGSTLYSFDYAGKDEYTATGTNSYLISEDYAGNDKYDFETGSKFYATDYKGNDEYSITSNKVAETQIEKRITDVKGSDKYKLDNANVTIVDEAGKDEYTISSSKIVDITDNDKGNDTFAITDCADLKYDEFSIFNAYGNEKYNLSQVTYTSESYTASLNDNKLQTIEDEHGNDTYTLSDSKNIKLYDHAGNDKYGIYTTKSTVHNITINDTAGRDSYTAKGNETYKITTITIKDTGNSNDKYDLSYVRHMDVSKEMIIDDGGKDTYNISNCINTRIEDSGDNADKYNMTDTIWFAIYDNSTKSKDIYNITHSWGYIYDKGGNDTYNISKILEKEELWIGDQGGDKDVLNLKDTKRDNIVFMADIYANGSYFKYNHGLILYDTETQGFINISNFFKINNGDLDGFGEGYIETIKANGKKLDTGSATIYENINQVRESVATWLTDNNQEDVWTVLSNGTDEQKQALVNLFTANNNVS